MIEKIYFDIAIILVILLLLCLYFAWSYDNQAIAQYEKKLSLLQYGIADSKTVNYTEFVLELKEDLKKHNIKYEDRQSLRKLMDKIVYEELSGRKSVFKKVISSSFYGLLQGGAAGFITGGVPGALGGGIVFGTVTPILTAFKELIPVDEQLISKN